MVQPNPSNARETTSPDAPAAGKRAEEVVAEPSRGLPPHHFGSYRVIGVLGHGGMGVVYRAEQANPRRQVALKVIGAGFVTSGSLKRFEREAQMLGRLNHPGIAQVYEAGTDDVGHGGPSPFIAMELVEGTTLTRFANQKRLSVRQRLDLFMRVCDAVQYAHQQGIIHRDLKPENILVTEDGEPKILDFGIAHAAEFDAGATTATQTQIGQLIGTLPYMSPEQARGNPDQIDTRSDVYALGVIAYELLGGKLPYQLQGVTLPEAVRIIQAEDPLRLSSIDRTYRGDVETIVGKALEKDKRRRYQTVNALRADIQRYLDYEPIAARPPSTWYQCSKFVRRNKLLVSSVAAIMLVLAGGVVVSTLLYVRAQRERQQAQEQAAIADAVSQFQNDMLASADPNKLLGEKVTVLQAIHGAVKELDSGKLKDQPLVEAAVRDTVGSTLRGLARFDEAQVNLERALELRRRVLPPDSLDIAGSLDNLAELLRDEGKLDQAEPLYRESLHICRESLPEQSKQIATVKNNLAMVLQARGRLSNAEPLFREALATRQKVLPASDPDVATSLNNLAMLLHDQGRLNEAEKLYREALAEFRRALPAGHPIIATAMNNLARLLEDQGRLAEAESLLREALAIRRKTLPAESPDLVENLDNLAPLLEAQGKLSEAEQLLREALRICRSSLPAEHPATPLTLNNLGKVLSEEGKFSEAESLLREAIADYRKLLPPGHPFIAPVLNNLAWLLRREGKLKESESLLREALAISRKALPAGHPSIATGATNLAMILEDEGNLTEAESLCREALEIRQKKFGSNAAPTTQTASVLADVLTRLNRQPEAATLRKQYALDGSVARASHPPPSTTQRASRN